MLKTGISLVILSCLLVACKNSDKDKDKEMKGEENTKTKNLESHFKEVSLPYQLSDTTLAKNNDTAFLPAIASLIPGSIKDPYFGKNATIKYVPLAKLGKKENYFLVKASAPGKKAAFLIVFDNENNFGAAYPFLLPDQDAATSQLTTIDKSYTITKAIVQRAGADIIGEGKEVVAYDPASKSFSLIMKDALSDNPDIITNPIDTFAKTNKLAGDYYLNKKNFVSIRDGRHINQLLVYIHTQNEEGDCKGELKGEFLITSATTAAYRLGGDPCVLGLSFSGNTVSIKEENGCGNHRDLDCPLNGTFTRKKQAVPKQNFKKGKGK